MELHDTTSYAFGERLTESPVLDPAGREAGQRLTHAKASSDDILPFVSRVLGYRYGQSLSICSSTLYLLRLSDGAVKIRPFASCRKRWCPVCEMRKSARRWALVCARLPAMLPGPRRWLLLTLTVRNICVGQVEGAVTTLLEGFRRLARWERWPADGWIRALEVTINPQAVEAHPHLHVLMSVKPSYFKVGYVSHRDWVAAWRRFARLDYDPVVDVRRVKSLSVSESPLESVSETVLEALGGLREVSKYVTKPADFSRAPELSVEALAALKNRRLIDAGGWLRGIFSEHEDGSESDENVDAVAEKIAVFWWRANERVYRRKLHEM